MNSHEASAQKLFQWVRQQAGISRRQAQELIAAGEVDVNGATVTDPYQQYPRTQIDRLSLRGQPLPLDAPEPRVYRFHKPPGMLCSNDDPFHGNTLGRFLRSEGFIGYAWIGRLDQDAEGLLLITNHGPLVHAFTHPRFEVEKEYRIWVDALPSRNALTAMLSEMKQGIHDSGDRLRIIDGRAETHPPQLVLTLGEGRKHEVKRLCGHFGLSVTRLLRVRMGPVLLASLPAGAIERLPAAMEKALFARAERTQSGGSRSRATL